MLPKSDNSFQYHCLSRKVLYALVQYCIVLYVNLCTLQNTTNFDILLKIYVNNWKDFIVIWRGEGMKNSIRTVS